MHVHPLLHLVVLPSSGKNGWSIIFFVYAIAAATGQIGRLFLLNPGEAGDLRTQSQALDLAHVSHHYWMKASSVNKLIPSAWRGSK
jgi:hypothetical protein